jgi:hypothetical protein
MFEKMIEELDKKVESLIDKNIWYAHEIERLNGLLDEANIRLSVHEKSNGNVLDELAPLAESILSRIEKQTGGE